MLSLMLMLTLVRRWSIVELLSLRLRLKLLRLLMIQLRRGGGAAALGEEAWW